MVQKVEEHRYRDKIINYFSSKQKSEERGTQTEETKEKSKSSSVLKVISLEKRSTISQGPRFARNFLIPRVHPCNKFIVSLAEKISKTYSIRKQSQDSTRSRPLAKQDDQASVSNLRRKIPKQGI